MDPGGGLTNCNHNSDQSAVYGQIANTIVDQGSGNAFLPKSPRPLDDRLHPFPQGDGAPHLKVEPYITVNYETIRRRTVVHLSQQV